MKDRIIFTLAFLLAFVVSVSAQKKISDYPNTATAANTDLMIWARPGATNLNQSYIQLAAQMRTNQYWTQDGTNVTYAGNVQANGVFHGPITTNLVTIGGQNARIQYLSQPLAKAPRPLAIYFHGLGEQENNAFTGYAKSITEMLVANGYIVASSAAGGNLWGNLSQIGHYENLYNYLTNTYSIGKVIFIGQSMGGISSLNVLLDAYIPCDAWYGVSPFTSLYSAYTNGFAASIETAYGFVGPANYAAATAGYDPNLAANTGYLQKRYRSCCSSNDTAVARVSNSDALFAKLAPYVREISIVNALGDHGDPSQFLPRDVLDFCNKDYAINYQTKYFCTMGPTVVPSLMVGTTNNYAPVTVTGTMLVTGTATDTPALLAGDYSGGGSFYSLRSGLGHYLHIDVYSTNPTAMVPMITINRNRMVGIANTEPGSMLHVAGPIATSVQVGGTVTLGATNSTYLLNVDANTVTLPTAVGINGRIYTIKLITPATVGTVTNATGAQTIDGALSYSLTASNKFVTVQSSGTNWWIIGNN